MENETIISNLKNAISAFCRMQVRENQCSPDDCDFCPVNDAYDMACDSLTHAVAAVFVSVWDGGIEISSRCLVNMETKEVFDIEPTKYDGDILEKEYVEIDGIQYPVSKLDDGAEYDGMFWYDA